MTMKIIASVAVLAVQLYILWIIGRTLHRPKSAPVIFPNPHKARMAVVSIAIIGLLESATTLYDINGPGTHFPLEIRIPVLLLETILMVKAF